MTGASLLAEASSCFPTYGASRTEAKRSEAEVAWQNDKTPCGGKHEVTDASLQDMRREGLI